MNAYPESLFQLSQRDQQVTWLDPFLRAASLSSASTGINRDFPVPTDRALILNAALIEVLAGAGQVPLNARVQLLTPVSGLVAVLASAVFNGAAAASRQALNWSGNVLIPPGWVVRCRAEFDLGAAANLNDAHLIGILVPAGNIARV